MYRFHRYNLIRWDISSPSVAYKLFVRGLYDYVIVKEETSSSVTIRGYFVASKGIEASWSNRASLTYSNDIQGRKLVNEGQNWLLANTGGEVFSGLLDEYEGAAAAYSLRKLSSSYSGDAIVVRRSSDNATQSIGFINNELDTSSLNSFCSGTDGFITTWYDQSGNGYNAIQATASQQPKIFDSIDGVILNNGKPSIETDGVDDLLDFGQSVDLYSLNSQWSVFMNYQIIDYSLQTFQRVLYNDSSSAAGDTPFGIQHRDNNLVYFGNNGTLDDVTAPSATQNNLTTFIKTSSDVFFKINNVSKASTKGTIDFTTGLENTVIGSSPNGFRPAKMYVSELIIYPNDQSSNRTGIEENINDFYSIY